MQGNLDLDGANLAPVLWSGLSQSILRENSIHFATEVPSQIVEDFSLEKISSCLLFDFQFSLVESDLLLRKTKETCHLLTRPLRRHLVGCQHSECSYYRYHRVIISPSSTSMKMCAKLSSSCANSLEAN